jgi:hypothetical protein
MNRYKVTYVDKSTKEVKILYTKAVDAQHIKLYMNMDSIERIISITEVESTDGCYAVVYKSPTHDFAKFFDNYEDAKEKLEEELEWCMENNPLEAYFYTIKWISR